MCKCILNVVYRVRLNRKGSEVNHQGNKERAMNLDVKLE